MKGQILKDNKPPKCTQNTDKLYMFNTKISKWFHSNTGNGYRLNCKFTSTSTRKSKNC